MMITDKAKNEIPSLPQLPTKPVRIKKTILSTDGKIIEIEEIVQIPYLAETHEGIVIVGSGSGNYNRKWMKTMEKLAEKGTVFVRASRVSQGIVFDDRVFDPMDVCIGANTLSGQKARVLLMLALTITKDVKQIRNIFNQY